MGWKADQSYLKGIRNNSIEDFKFASKWFPFDKDIISGEAELYIKYGIINQSSLNAVKKAVLYDNNSPRLLSIQLQYGFVLGDTQIVRNSFQKLKQVAPNMVIVKQLISHGAN